MQSAMPMRQRCEAEDIPGIQEEIAGFLECALAEGAGTAARNLPIEVV
jgi:hypothetical protein